MNNSEELVMYLIVRNDLSMSTGKIAAQVGHAVADLVHEPVIPNDIIIKDWFSDSQAKIVLGANLEEFDNLINRFESGETYESPHGNLFIDHCVVHDQGRTQIPEGSRTVIGMSPMPKDQAKKFVGHLKLL